MRVVVAPDKFRGTLTAAQAAGAIAVGWRRMRPQDVVEEVPLADGGEGSLDVIIESVGGRRCTALVDGPLGDPTLAEYGLLSRGDRTVAIVEISRASGLGLLTDGRRDVLRATTRGIGELIRAACKDASEVEICLGGSATNDAGAGMAQAVGYRLLDKDGRDVQLGGAALLTLSAIDAAGVEPFVRSARFLGAFDVNNPLTGPQGASVVYGPQKGRARRMYSCWTERSRTSRTSSAVTWGSTFGTFLAQGQRVASERPWSRSSALSCVQESTS